MGVVGDLLLAGVAVGIALWAPLEVGFAAVVACWLLVPGQLVVPHLPHIVLIDRLVLYGFAGRLLLRSGRPGEPPGRAYALTPLHGAFALLLVVAFVNGSVLLPPGGSLAAGLHSLLALLDLAVFFVVTLAVARTGGLWKVVRAVVAVLLVAAVIGLLERITGHGWSHFFFEGLPLGDLAAGASPLGLRNGHVRSQGAAQFALEYGWVLALLLPMLVVALRRWFTRGRLATIVGIAGILAVGLAAAFSSSRSALVMAPVMLGAVVLMAADRRLVLAGLGLLVIGAVVVLVHPALVTGTFSSGNATDPLSIRLQRLPALFSLVAHRPFTGIGFFGATSVYGGLDDAYALLYANIGMTGLLAYLAVMVTALALALRSWRAPRGSEPRLVGMACAVGIVGVMGAFALYDGSVTTQTPWLLAFVGGLGAAAAEQVEHRPVAGRRWARRAALPLVGLGAGLAVLATSPTSASESLTVYTVAPYIQAYESGPTSQYVGTTLTNTLCGLVTASSVVPAGTQVQCTLTDNVIAYAYPAEALVTVRAATPAAVRAEVTRAFTPAFHLMWMTGGISTTMQTGKPAWAVTAPLWAAAGGVGLMLWVPPLRRRRRRPGQGPLGERPAIAHGATKQPDGSSAACRARTAPHSSPATFTVSPTAAISKWSRRLRPTARTPSSQTMLRPPWRTREPQGRAGMAPPGAPATPSCSAGSGTTSGEVPSRRQPLTAQAPVPTP